jgi:hypothetical protein
MLWCKERNILKTGDILAQRKEHIEDRAFFSTKKGTHYRLVIL